MSNDLQPASLAHLKGHGLIHIDLGPTRDRDDQLVYGLRPKGGVFLCEPVLALGELELLLGKELAFFGYGRSELGLYTLMADVHLADRKDYPEVSLRVIRLYDVRVVGEAEFLEVA